ncbi:MAG: glycosyltransferase [Acidimicrobiales bacterium]
MSPTSSRGYRRWLHSSGPEPERVRLAIVTWRDLAHPLAGGSEIVVDRLARGFIERGHEVTVVCGGPVGPHTYRVIRAGGTYSQYLLAPIECMKHLGSADLLVDVENGIPFFSPLWHRGPKVCLVHHVHSDQWRTRFPAPVAYAARLVEQRLMPAVYRNQAFVAVSPSTASALEGIGIDRNRIRVIESGVDTPPSGDPALARSPDPLFVAIGRLVPHKRVNLLLDVWARVLPVVGGSLVIAGSGPELEHLRRIAPPGADLPGHVSEETKADLLQRAWFLVHSAHHEGWGMSILEAAAYGTPALALDVPGVRDAIVDGTTGELAHDPDDLARRWIALASDTPRRAQMGRAAAERASRLTWNRTVDSYLELAGKLAGTGETTSSRLDAPAGTGIQRSVKLFRSFLHQLDDPGSFYTLLAEDTAWLASRYARLEGARIVDVGSGPGYFATAFSRHGALAVMVERDPDELNARGRPRGVAVLGDGCRLPFADSSFDISHSSNVIEHVSDPRAMFDEMLRVLRPGGVAFLAFTNWWSPFGGHETSPWHYLGGRRAAQRYERHRGGPPKNLYGTSLFRLHIGQVLGWARSDPRVVLLDCFPRYYPRWARPLMTWPGLREVATWNAAIVLRKR